MPVVNYLWDDEEDNIIAEYDENGNVIVEYTTEPGYHGAVISEHRNGQTYYHIHDGQGNLRALTNDQGEVTDTFAYTANGELTERTGDTPTPFQFGGAHGYYTDQTTGEIMARRRILSPREGRWLSPDPSSFDAGKNRFLYSLNNPINLIDPSGLQPIPPGRKRGPGDFPSPNFRLINPTCEGCGNYDMQWWLESAELKETVYVQILCFHFELDPCKEMPNCAGGQACVPGALKTGHCCIVEWIGYGGPPVPGVHHARDHWAFIVTGGKGNCIARGFAGQCGWVYGFHDESESAKRIREWPEWKKVPKDRDDNLFNCSGALYHVGNYFRLDWKKLPKELNFDNPDLNEYGRYCAGHYFDCCPIQKDDKGRLEVEIGGGIEQGKNTYQCGTDPLKHISTSP